ncbi:MAG: hypothetical protein JST16_00080 [Bdellovibrionales bacterium]|nr:hypothetical protein [Bdellovibrionales bacterium]
MVFFGGFLLFFYLVRLWLAGFGGIHPDEAYYWFWSRHLSLGYFDHPPMVAWLIRLGDGLLHLFLPQSAFDAHPAFFAQIGLRLVPYFVSCVLTPLTVAACIENMQKRSLGVTEMIALISAPVFIFGPQVVTPDTPFFFGWSLCLLINLKLTDSRGLEATPGDPTPFRPVLAILGGIALAFTAYSKHTAVLAAALFFICGTGPFNSLLAGLTALLLTLPHFAWYLSTGIKEGGGALFQFKNALGDTPQLISYKRMGDLVASQVFFWTPLTFLLALAFPMADIHRFFLPRKLRRPTGTLFLWAFVPIVFFSLSALRRPAEANWPLVGVVAALTLVISKMFNNRKALYAITLSHLLVGVLAAFALFNPAVLADLTRPTVPQLAAQLDKPSRLREFTDWDRFHTLIFEATSRSDDPVLVQSYQLLSGLIFYDAASPHESLGDRLKIWDEGSRKSEFQLHRERVLDTSVHKRYWLLAAHEVKTPSGCELSQTLYKNVNDSLPFQLFRCGF